MKGIGCTQCRERLSEYLDEMLGDREMRRIATHLAGCDACAAELEDLRLVKLALQKAPDPEPARDFWSRVYREVEREAERSLAPAPRIPARPQPRRRVRLGFGWVGAAALTAAALAAALLLFWPQQDMAADDVDQLVIQHAAHGVIQPLGDWSRMRYVSCELRAASAGR